MDNNLKTSLWQQFGAAIDYLEQTIRACPDTLWHTQLWQTPNHPPERSHFWYLSYHTIFWLHLYLTGDVVLPSVSLKMSEHDDYCPMPERAFTKDELLPYLADGRAKCKTTIDALTEQSAARMGDYGWGECSYLELLMYNMRHIHGHSTQLNMLLGQNGISTPDYPPRMDN